MMKLSALPVGVLSVHIKRASKISIDKDKESLGDWKSLLLRIIVDDVSKESKIATIDYNTNECKFDDLKHFLVKTYQIKEDIKNELKLELYSFGKIDENKYLYRLAYRYINIIDLVRVMNVCESFEMTDNKRLVAMLDLEFCFSFGRLGYGYSNQIEVDKLADTKERISFSNFLRVEPPDYRKVEEFCIIEAVTINPPEIINFSQTIDAETKFYKKFPVIYNVKSSEFPLLNEYFKESTYLNEAKNGLNVCKSRFERLEYLNLILSNRERYLDLVAYDDDFSSDNDAS